VKWSFRKMIRGLVIITIAISAVVGIDKGTEALFGSTVSTVVMVVIFILMIFLFGIQSEEK